MNKPKQIEANKVFTVIKGKRTARWKVVDHPYLNCYGLVRDYTGRYGMMTSKPCNDDEDHIVAAIDLDEAYDVAYDMT